MQTQPPDDSTKRPFTKLPAVIRQQVSTAPLPVNYERAKAALAECDSIDECKDWLDKAVAIASYARQAKDNSLVEKATRIQLRASERMGELLLAIPAAHGIRVKGDRGGTRPNPESRQQAYLRAGVSATQAHRAMRIAALPKEVRDGHINASPPPSLHKLGSKIAPPRPNWKNRGCFTGGEAYRGLVQSIAGLGSFRTFLRRPAYQNPAELARLMSRDEAARLRPIISEIEEWLDTFDRHLPKADA
jgi:hypothetical protein